MVALIGIGGSELLLILGAALVLLGPKRLPEIARQLGKVSNQLRDANRDLKRELYANLEPPPAAATRGDELSGGVPAPRPVARQIEQGAAAALPAAGDSDSASDSDYDAPYRDAEAEAKRVGTAMPGGEPAPAVEPAVADPAGADADPPAPPTQKADPDESGSAS